MPRKLRVEYRTEESFRREYSENIARGGIFIPTRHQLAMREPVEIELVLAFQDESVVLPGEVVHCIPPEMAETGAQPGVAIQFLIESDDLRSKLQAFGGQPTHCDERVQGTGRRVSPRYRARVPAAVDVNGAWIAGHTRNVSNSGALVALPGEPPPIGARVGVRIDHPSGNDQLEIGGVVARHVESAGSACVGIQFRVPEASELQVADFMKRLQAVEHSRRLGGINGPIADLGIRSVLAMFGSCAPEGMLTLTRGAEEGYITIDQGSLRAQVGARAGREALDYLLSWSEGSFEFEGHADDGLVNGESTPLCEIVPDAPLPRGLESGEAMDDPDLSHMTKAVEDEPDFEAEEDADQELVLTDLAVSDFEGDLRVDDDEDDDEDDEREEYGQEEGLPDDTDGEFFVDHEADSLEEFVIDDEEADSLEARVKVEASPIDPAMTLQLVPDGERWELSKTEEALLDLAAVGMTVAKAIDIIPEPASDIYVALQSLLDEDLLTLG